jgi:hypothetical protein
MNRHERRHVKSQARRQSGRPKGSTVPLERHRQRHQIAIWKGFRLCGYGPTVSAYWAAWATSDKPIQPEDANSLLTVAGTVIPYTASTLEKHIDRLARNAERTTSEQADNHWLAASSLAIKAMILAARTGNTEVYCGMIDVLIELGDWRDVLVRLADRVIAASKSNVPPHEGKLGRQGQALFDWLRSAMEGKT